MKIELLLISYLVFIWFLSGWAAFSGLSRGRIRRLEPDNRPLAERLENWLEKSEEYETVFRLLVFFAVGIMAATLWLLLTGFLPGLPPAKAMLTAAAALFVLLTLSIVPVQLLAVKFDLWVIRLSLPPVIALRATLFRPVIWLLNRAMEKMNRKAEGNQEGTSAEDEILGLVEQEADAGGGNALAEDEKRMIRGIFDLDYTLVREIMTPRVDMITMPITASVQEAKKLFVESGHSRIPVYHGNIDEVKGVIYAKDFLDDTRLNGGLDPFVHKAVFIPEMKNVGVLLKELKSRNIHVAIVIDEYGGTAGIVSLEDIIEEIVGDIRDEYDTEEDGQPDPVMMPDGSVAFSGRAPISDVNETMKLDLPEDEDVDTIGGFVCGAFGRIPEPGEEFEYGPAKITVLRADKRRILTIKIKLPEGDTE